MPRASGTYRADVWSLLVLVDILSVSQPYGSLEGSLMTEWTGFVRYAGPVVLVGGIMLEQVQGHGHPHIDAEGHVPSRPQIGGRIELTAATTAAAMPRGYDHPLASMCAVTE